MMSESQACVVSGSALKPPEALHNGYCQDRLSHADAVPLGLLDYHSCRFTVAEEPLPQAGSRTAKLVALVPIRA